MTKPDVRLFTLVCNHTGIERHVTYVPGYGITAPQLWTTNGSHTYVARHVSDRVRIGDMSVKDSILPTDTDFSYYESLRVALRAYVIRSECV